MSVYRECRYLGRLGLILLAFSVAAEDQTEDVFLVDVGVCMRPVVVSVPYGFEKAYLKADLQRRHQILLDMHRASVVPMEVSELFLRDWEAPLPLPNIVVSAEDADFQNTITDAQWAELKTVMLANGPEIQDRLQEVYRMSNDRQDDVTVLKAEILDTYEVDENTVVSLQSTSMAVEGGFVQLLVGRHINYVNSCLIAAEVVVLDEGEESMQILKGIIDHIRMN